MDWGTVITSMFGIGIIEGSFKIIDKIRFKKEDKTEKKETVEQTAVATDRQQIDLGDLFLEKTQKWAEVLESNSTKMIEKMDESNKRRDADWRKLNDDIELLKKDVTEIKNEQKIETAFLNGEYEAFRKKWKNNTN